MLTSICEPLLIIFHYSQTRYESWKKTAKHTALNLRPGHKTVDKSLLKTADKEQFVQGAARSP